jgi:DeoR family fructose operon transcriptional repressor
VVVLADHTKIGNDCFARVAGLDEADVLISDDELDAAVAVDLQAAGPRVVLA